MADWKDSLLEGSIGGVPLFVQAVATRVGRRTTSRALPFRDTPAREDLGRSPRQFGVEAIVIGNDYLTQKEKVVAVFESAGPHIFVHPWLGEISVILDEGSSLDVQENHAEGGWAKLSFNLVESGSPDGARIKISTSAALSVASVAAIEAAKVSAKKKFGLGNVFNALSKGISALSGGLLKVKRKAFGALGVSQAAGIADSLADLNSTIGKLANSPAELLTTLSGIVAALKGIFKSQAAANDESPNSPYPGGAKKVVAEAALSAAEEMCAIETITPPLFEGAPVDPVEVAAQKALSDFTKALVISETIDLMGTLPLESASVAINALTTLGGLADDLLSDPDTEDDVFVAMTDLRAALDAHLAVLVASLPRVQQYIPAEARSALLIAFELYGDPTRDLEIVGRNRVRDPNFVPGGEPLEVLLDV
jgi:prophage DNA circulation protein